jgi:polyhydroxyalkanoate synthesis regulator phasin
LNSAHYYAQATSVAAQKLDEIGNTLLGNWGKMHPQQARQHLEEMIVSAKYIEKAATFQKKSFQDLASGIRVSTQVTEQLSTNATKTLASATLMEEVVEQLRDVVGQSEHADDAQTGREEKRRSVREGNAVNDTTSSSHLDKRPLGTKKTHNPDERLVKERK